MNLTEDRLRAVAREAGDALDHAPLPEEDHAFSEKYRRAVRQMEGRSRHPAWSAGLRRVAVILVVLLLPFSGWMTVDAQAREVVFGWVSEKVTNGYLYSFFGDRDTQTDAQYTLTEIPAGYELYEHYEGTGYVDDIYIDQEGSLFTFTYIYDRDVQTSLLSGMAEKEAVLVGDVVADYYPPAPDDPSSSIVWYDDETGVMLHISGFAGKSDMIHYAESVERVEE